MPIDDKNPSTDCVEDADCDDCLHLHGLQHGKPPAALPQGACDARCVGGDNMDETPHQRLDMGHIVRPGGKSLDAVLCDEVGWRCDGTGPAHQPAAKEKP